MAEEKGHGGSEAADDDGRGRTSDLKEAAAALFKSLWVASSLSQKIAKGFPMAAQEPLLSIAAYVRMAIHAEESIINTLGIGGGFADVAKETAESNAAEALMAVERSSPSRVRLLRHYVEESRDKLQAFVEGATDHLDRGGEASGDVDAARVAVAGDLGARALDLALQHARKTDAVINEAYDEVAKRAR